MEIGSAALGLGSENVRNLRSVGSKSRKLCIRFRGELPGDHQVPVVGKGPRLVT